MVIQKDSGFSEIDHTADWAINVWAPSLSELFVQAAKGMYWLMETTLRENPRVEREIALEGADHESLLVSFLSELLYLGDSEEQGFDHFEVTVEDTRLVARLQGAPVQEQKKEIKAVTFHNLQVRQKPEGYDVTIVFDV